MKHCIAIQIYRCNVYSDYLAVLLLLAAMIFSVLFIDGNSSENTTESVSSLSFNTIGVAPPA